MESVQRNARPQLPEGQDEPDATQEADAHRPAGTWRDHVRLGHLQGDECLPRYFTNPHHTTLFTGRHMNAPALLNPALPQPVRQAINTQAAYMQVRNDALDALHEVQEEVTQAEAELTTAQRALVAARGMVGGPSQMELTRVGDAVEQLRRKLDERGVIERDLETNQGLVDQGHAHLEARLKERDASYRWHHNQANRVAVYALAMALAVAIATATVGFGEEAINRGFNDRIERVDRDLGPVPLGVQRSRDMADDVREFGPEFRSEHAAGYAQAHQWRADAQLFDQLVPPYLAMTMLVVVFAVEVIYQAVHNQRFGQQ